VQQPGREATNFRLRLGEPARYASQEAGTMEVS
jgi:hypothetical protein